MVYQHQDVASRERIFEASGASCLVLEGRGREGNRDYKTGMMKVVLWTDGQLFLVLTVLF